MFNVFACFLRVLVFVYLLGVSVCDVWDDGDQLRMLNNIIPELYWKYREALDGSDESTFTYRRAIHNKEYIIHINRLKTVNGLKRHNLIVKESSNDDPLIYINNPVETQIPNPYLTLEGFKDLLVDRAQRHRNEFGKTYKTTSTSTTKFNIKKLKMTHQNKRILVQTKPNNYVETMKTKTKTFATKTKTSVMAKIILTSTHKIRNKRTHIEAFTKTSKAFKFKTRSNKNKSTTLKSKIRKNINDKLNVKVSSITEFKTEKVIYEKSSTEKWNTGKAITEDFMNVSITTEPTSHKAIREAKNEVSATDKSIHKKSTEVKFATEALISQKSIIEMLTNNLTSEGTATEETITKKSTTKELTSDKTTIEKVLEKKPAETTLNILRTHVKSKDLKSEEVRKNATIEIPVETNEILHSEETNILNTTGTLNIDESNTAELSKKPIIIETTKEITPIEEVTTEFIKKEVTMQEFINEDLLNNTDQPSTIASYLKRKSTSRDQESSDEAYWTKRETSRRTTKATTRRSTLGRPMVYMGGDNEGWDRWN